MQSTNQVFTFRRQQQGEVLEGLSEFQTLKLILNQGSNTYFALITEQECKGVLQVFEELRSGSETWAFNAQACKLYLQNSKLSFSLQKPQSTEEQVQLLQSQLLIERSKSLQLELKVSQLETMQYNKKQYFLINPSSIVQENVLQNVAEKILEKGSYEVNLTIEFVKQKQSQQVGRSYNTPNQELQENNLLYVVGGFKSRQKGEFSCNQVLYDNNPQHIHFFRVINVEEEQNKFQIQVKIDNIKILHMLLSIQKIN